MKKRSILKYFKMFLFTFIMFCGINIVNVNAETITKVEVSYDTNSARISPFYTHYEWAKEYVKSLKTDTEGTKIMNLLASNFRLFYKDNTGEYVAAGSSLDDEKIDKNKSYALRINISADTDNGYSFDTTDDNYKNVEVWLNGVRRDDAVIYAYSDSWKEIRAYIPVEVDTSPFVKKITISQEDDSVTKGTTKEYQEDILFYDEGNLGYNKVEYIVTGATSSNTKFDGNILTVGEDETASTLTIKAKSVMTPEVESNTLTVNVVEEVTYPDKPTLKVNGTYIYTGSEITTDVVGFDSTTMNITGNKGTNAKEYTIIVTPKTKWSDGTTDEVKIKWRIDTKILPMPVLSKNTFAYSSEELDITNYFTGYDSSLMKVSGNVRQTNAKDNYSVTIRLIDEDNYEFEGYKTFKTYTWSITKVNPTYTEITGLEGIKGSKLSSVTLPSDSNGSWTWTNGNTIMNTFGNQMFEATYTPTDITNYNTVKVNIAVNVVEGVAYPDKPTLKVNGTYTYTGSEITADVVGFDSTTMNITGNKGTNAKEYTIIVTPKTKWSDGTTDEVKIKWRIDTKILPMPVLSKNAFPYSKTEINIMDYFIGYDSNLMTVSGDVKQTTVGPKGSYTVTIRLKDENNYEFEGYKTFKQYTWSITKVDPTYTIPTGLVGVRGNYLVSISLGTTPEGKWDWCDESILMLTLGNQAYEALYTPYDTRNYNVVRVNIPVNVVESVTYPEKPELRIGGTNIYDGSEQTVVVTGFDKTSMNITGNKATNAGTYEVVITPKTKWSDGTTDELRINWTIKKANPVVVSVSRLEGIKGSKLSSVIFPSDSNGTWSWKEENTIMETVGNTIYKAIYTPNDTDNYNVIEVYTTVNVKDIIVNKYNVITSVDGGNGTITSSKNDIVENSVFEVIFTPDTGYMIDKVFVNGNEVEVINNKLELTINESKEIVVSYKKIPFTIIIKDTDGATITPNGIIDVNYGDDKEITITANDGYKLVNVLVDGVDKINEIVDNRLILTNITDDMKIEVVVEKVINEDKSINPPKTFDNIIIYTITGILSLLGLLGMIAIKRKQMN